MPKRPKHKTRIQSVSDTQLLVASAAAALSAGLSLIAVPMSAPELSTLPTATSVSKCEVQSFFVQDSSCFKTRMYDSAQVVCGDGYTTRVIPDADHSCFSSAVWEKQAREVCKSRCVRKDHVTEEILLESENDEDQY